jgi:hypothetical protein
VPRDHTAKTMHKLCVSGIVMPSPHVSQVFHRRLCSRVLKATYQ